MSRQAVASDEPDGAGDRVWLDQVGIVTELKYSSAYSGGPQAASWSLLAPEMFEHRALAPGRRIRIFNGGAVVWQGRLDLPGPGAPWSCAATGIGAMAADYRAFAPSSNNALSMNEVVDAAITRGLPWTRNASIPAETGTNAPTASTTLDQALADVSDRNNLYWTVTPDDGEITMAAAPTAPTHLLYATDQAAGRALTGYITSLYVHYMDSTTNIQKTVRVTNATAETRFGTKEDELDLTGDSPITSTQATNFGTSFIAKSAPRTYFSGAFTATAGQLTNLGGIPIDLASATAGMVLRVHYVTPTANGELFPGTIADLLVGQVEYDSDADTLSITPVSPPTTSHMLDEISRHAKAEYQLAQKRKAARLAAEKRKLAAAKRHAAYLHSLKTQARQRATIAHRKARKRH